MHRKPTETLPRRAFILDCFGRGGSNIVWNIIGSSPDVLMPSLEWHQAVFGNHHKLRKAARSLARHVDLKWIPGATGAVAARTTRSISFQEWALKPDASATVLKVMDRHIVFAPLIEAGFETTRHVVLTRHPLPMCEGLIRDGEGEDSAARIYNGVAADMLTMAHRPDAVMVRFEDLIADPAAFYRQLTEELAIPAPRDGLVGFVQKKFGASRTNADHGGREKQHIPPEGLRSRIDANVNADSVNRLPVDRRQRLWEATAEAASALGYDETGF